MLDKVEASFVTTTSYGSWLPGDIRGYFEHGQVLPASPGLAQFSLSQMNGALVSFDATEQDALFDALAAAAAEFGYRLSDAVVESTHVHWIICHDDAMEAMVGRLKNRMRQRLNRGRIWTTGYCGSELRTLNSLQQAREYLVRHAGARMVAGQAVRSA
ncbi:MAG TPA: hypothetical protein PKC18_09715 [Lacipirellulaceae bacterium]|nr:hypothetical protein [Lacipirellulaceae bacterium]HMP06993.1 hypothetical protein [Lacipirellulaceae bacterium]